MKLSILDQSPISVGKTAHEAVQATLDLAEKADQWGYTRYWLAEHHSSGTLADASPEILLAAMSARTENIRIGSGGVMLSHYSALKVAETFRMLEALAPGRVDMGLGRAPGSDQMASFALQSGPNSDPIEKYPQKVFDLMRYLSETFPTDHPFGKLRAMPASPSWAAPWLLSSSMGSAGIAARLGLPLSFAHFIAQDNGPEYVKWYRDNFEASEWFEKPRVNIGISAITADTAERAYDLATCRHVMRLMRNKGQDHEMKGVPSVDEIKAMDFDGSDLEFIEQQRTKSIEGDPATVKAKIENLAEQYETDDVIVLTITHDYAERQRSYELLAQAFNLTGEGRVESAKPRS
ncbi:MAG: LLM class flavin-dependent oxidoreductase [Chloroflexi bacterium]|nr:LLM class flavin-dependent oxidoreductase [Chloroflexota bacterium]